MTTGPVVAIGLRLQKRLDGSSYLVGVVDAALTLAPGTELQLVRVAADHHAGDGPTHALRVLPPRVAPTAAALRRAAADRLDATAFRQPNTREPG